MKGNIKSNYLLFILVFIIILMSIMNGSLFLSMSNVRSMSYQLPLIGFISFGMLLPIIVGGINLGIIATTNFCGITIALTLKYLTGGNTSEATLIVSLVSILIGFAAAIGVGVIAGILVAYFRVPDILATLGTMTLFNGINIVLTKGYTLTGFSRSIIFIGNGKIFGIPFPFYLFIIAAIILYIFSNRTSLGYKIYLVGSNYVASKFSNINVRSVIMKSYIISSVFAAITSIVMMGQFNSVKSNYAESYLLVGILACFLGGVDPQGGAGKISGLVLSVVILQILSSGINLLRMDPYLTRVMWGFLVLLSLILNYSISKKRL
jgi:simple sugar transport system permease protein